MHSPPHRANILNPSFGDLGVGFACGTPGDRKRRRRHLHTDFGYAPT